MGKRGELSGTFGAPSPEASAAHRGRGVPPRNLWSLGLRWVGLRKRAGSFEKNRRLDPSCGGRACKPCVGRGGGRERGTCSQTMGGPGIPPRKEPLC